MSGDLYYINVHEKDDHAILHRLGPKDLRSAERIEMGLNLKLDHDQFYTEIVPAKEAENFDNGKN